MKITALAFAAALISLQSFSQGMYGFEGGLGRATAGKSYTTPVFTGYVLGKLTRSFYVGVAVSYQQYSFRYSYNHSAASLTDGDIISIRNKSSYVIFSPKLDFGIGYRKYFHLHTTFGLGLLAEGCQVSNTYGTYAAAPPVSTGHDTMAVYSTHNLPTLLSRYTIGVTWRIPTLRYWNIVVGGEYAYIPTNLSTHGPGLRTNFYCFTVGISHKYPMTFVEY
jgi:hypothetical protein